MMKKTRGFRIGQRTVNMFRLFIHRRRIKSRASIASRAMSKICEWGRSLKHGANRSLCSAKKQSGYVRVGQEPDRRPVSVPKGHLAVYVGDKEDDTCRVLVPVIYFNHPLFADLLREAEKRYGFDHQGGIQIPCQKSEFDNVRMRIAAASGGARCPGRWRCIKG